MYEAAFSSEYVYRIVQAVQYLEYCTFHHKMKGWIKNQGESKRTRGLVVVVSTFRQFFADTLIDCTVCTLWCTVYTDETEAGVVKNLSLADLAKLSRLRYS